MRTSLLVGIVVAVHCVALGSVILIQGCGTMTGPVSPPPEPKMPPTPVRVDQPPARTWPAETTTYVVRDGECLSGIAKRYNLSVAEITALNRISNPDVIRSGQKLILPGRIDLGVSRLPRKTEKPRFAMAGNVYIVKRGDCLSVIAANCGTTVAAIKDANGLSGDMITVGQKLIIPGIAVEEVFMPDIGIQEIPEVDVNSEPVSDVPWLHHPRPPVGERKVKPARDAPEEPTGRVSIRIHVVELDEDLYSVAMMWGVSVEELKKLNGLTDTSLRPGQRLKIPIAE